ncbi:hypothetical protein [Streptomyces sp. NPDC001744]|uniref:hypothetical protein n=1 Tax=Streptomyces sp. NPDC001744 TaxID=3364606 RepID=UPI0036B04D73
MARRTEYDEAQTAQRLKVPVTAFRWARHTGTVPAPDLPAERCSRAAVEALDAGAVRAAMSEEAIPGGMAADRIAAALGTPNVSGEKPVATSFVVRRLVARGLLVDLSGNPSGTLHHPGQVAEVCAREDLAELVTADTPLGPDQATTRLGVRRVEFDWTVRLKWIRAAEWAKVWFGTSRAGAVEVPLYPHRRCRRPPRRPPRSRLGGTAPGPEGPMLAGGCHPQRGDGSRAMPRRSRSVACLLGAGCSSGCSM